MLKIKLIIWNKYRCNNEKWVFGKLMSLIFLNEKVEEFTSSWVQNFVDIRILATCSKKFFNIVYEVQTDYMFSPLFVHGDVLLV